MGTFVTIVNSSENSRELSWNHEMMNHIPVFDYKHPMENRYTFKIEIPCQCKILL